MQLDMRRALLEYTEGKKDDRAAQSGQLKTALANLTGEQRQELEATRQQNRSALLKQSGDQAYSRDTQRQDFQATQGDLNRGSRERIAESAEAGREMRNVRSLGERQQEYQQTFAQREQQFDRKLAMARQKADANQPTPEDIKDVAQGIASYRQAPYSGVAARSGAALKVMEQVYKLNPSYDATNWQARNRAITAFATGKQGDTIRSLHVANSHLDTLAELAGSIKNGDAKALNAIKNFAWNQLGYPEPASLDAARQIIAAEVIKAVSATGGGVKERLEAAAHIDKNASFESMMGAISTYRKLLDGQLNGFKSQYETATGNKDFNERFRFGDSFGARFDAAPVKNKTSTGIEWSVH